MPLLKFIFLAICLPLLIACQSEAPPPADPEKLVFAELEERADLREGLFDFYRLNDTGELYMKVSPDQLGQDFLHLATFQDGLSSSWTMRGGYAGKRIIRLQRDFDKLVFLQVNTHYYFDPDSALAKASAANLPPAVLAIADITDENEDGELLVKVNPVFLSEALHQIKRPGDPKAEPGTEFGMGELSLDKTRLQELRNYPDNVDLFVNYVYEDPAPLVSGGQGLTDNRVVVLAMQHSLVKLPDNDFQPRFEDPRIGYFSDRSTDQTSYSATPFRDPIQRWNLVKKNPGAALSEPVQPIVYWLENTTPHEYRDVILEAALSWNQAFESAGFKNAFQVKVQPDDAAWDAADIRYNVLRWTASDESPWGGYGPRFSDPRTGQIIGADIMLEFRWLTGHFRRDQLFGQPLGMTNNNGALVEQCQAGAYKQAQLAMARAASGVAAGSPEESELVKQSLHDLIIHEIGHTLGLNHNFKASYYLSPDELASKETTRKKGVAASIMDYTPVNHSLSGQEQADYYLLEPGVYDHWAITYGYSEALDNPAAESQRLDAILARSTEPGLDFAIDADDMRSSASGIDPRAMPFDHSSDPLVYAERRIELVRAVGEDLLVKMARENSSWQDIYNGYNALVREWAGQTRIASRWIGGIYVDRSFQGQPGGEKPLQPVSRRRQQQAMKLLSEALFADNALTFSAGLYQHLQPHRRGQSPWLAAQDPKILGQILGAQKQALDHLLHPVTLARINDSTLYGNEYALAEVLSDLSEAIFAADMHTPVAIQRQQLQREYVEQLLRVADVEVAAADYDHVSRASALYQLLQLRGQLQGRPIADPATQAHTAALLHRIDTALDRG